MQYGLRADRKFTRRQLPRDAFRVPTILVIPRCRNAPKRRKDEFINAELRPPRNAVERKEQVSDNHTQQISTERDRHYLQLPGGTVRCSVP